mgnify:CR=1 FL=1
MGNYNGNIGITQLTQLIKNKIDGLMPKVKKSDGVNYKVLSDNDLTDELKANYDAAYIHSLTHTENIFILEDINSGPSNNNLNFENAADILTAYNAGKRILLHTRGLYLPLLNLYSASDMTAHIAYFGGAYNHAGYIRSKLALVQVESNHGYWESTDYKIPSFAQGMSGGYENSTDTIVSPKLLKDYVAEVAAGITGMNYRILGTGEYNADTGIPTVEGEAGTIYLVPLSQTETDNIYAEFIFVGSTFEKIGTTAVDLSGYWKKTDLTEMTADDVTEIWNAVFGS